MNKNINKHAVPFSKTNQPNKAAIKKRSKARVETLKKRRELTDLLSIVLKGEFGEQINGVLEAQMGAKAETLEEALHFVQIAKAISDKDTQAYQALMATSGLNKPVKTDVTTNGQSINKEPDYSKLSTKELLQLKEINKKCAAQ